MDLTGDVPAQAQRSHYSWHDVRFIGAIAGRYALPDRRRKPDDKLQVYACRLCSVSTRMLVAVAPVLPAEGERVCAHFDAFGMLQGQATRALPSGFVMQLSLTPAERDRLGPKIDWQRKHVHAQLPDKRDHRRIQPRDPRSVITLADGSTLACFVLDISSSGLAVSAPIYPDIGTPMAVGRVVGRVVRFLDCGFALQFLAPQPQAELEALLVPPGA